MEGVQNRKGFNRRGLIKDSHVVLPFSGRVLEGTASLLFEEQQGEQRGVVSNVLDCDHEVSVFKLRWHYLHSLSD